MTSGGALPALDVTLTVSAHIVEASLGIPAQRQCSTQSVWFHASWWLSFVNKGSIIGLRKDFKFLACLGGNTIRNEVGEVLMTVP